MNVKKSRRSPFRDCGSVVYGLLVPLIVHAGNEKYGLVPTEHAQIIVEQL